MSIFSDIAVRKSLQFFVNKRESVVRKSEDINRLIGMAKDELSEVTRYGHPWEQKMDLDQQIKEIDRIFWRHAFDYTGLAKIMDSKARSEFDKSLESNPPVFNMDNIRSVFLDMSQQADMMFKRGIVETFRYLSKNYKTNQKEPFKLGHKAIMTYMVQPSFKRGLQVRYERYNQLNDIDRVFKILDNQPFIERSLESQLNAAFEHGEVFEDEYFKFRAFANGNCHVWFKRADLLEKINDLVAEYYGENKLASG